MTRASILLSLLLACGGRSPAPATSAQVGPAGGTVQIPGGPTLTVPAGALSAAVGLTAEELPDQAPAGALTSIYRFGPQGTVFARPASITFPHAAPSPARVCWSKAGNAAVYEELDTFSVGASATANIGHLGQGYVGTCAAPAKRTVSGALRTVYETESGSRTTASGAPVENPISISAILVAGNAGYTTFPVTMASDSSFSVPGVPEGHYFLQIDAPEDDDAYVAGDPQGLIHRTLVEMTTSAPDLSTLVAGRRDRTDPLQPTPSGMYVTGLTAARSDVRVVSPNGSVHASVYHISGTTLNTTLQWNDAGRGAFNGLPDAVKGDVTWLYQLADTTVGAGQDTYTRPTTYARLANLSIPSGNPFSTPVTAAMLAAPQTGSLRTDLRISAFAGLAAAVNPRAQHYGSTLSILGIPRATAFPDAAERDAIPLGKFTSFSSLDVDEGTLTYGQVPAAPWREVLRFVHEWRTYLRDPDSTINYGVEFGRYVAQVPMQDAPAAQVPALSPPRAPLIDGQDGFKPRSGTGTEPVIAWSPPAQGTPSHYVVRFRPFASGLQPGDVKTISALVYSGSSFRVPPGFLQAGIPYSGNVTAVSAAGDAIDAPPERQGGAFVQVGCDFGLFRP